ncbi:helix-turn-helix domain-containing protein (plasmid) [Fructilactobacillus ixorae]|uniref:Helix-turn-helix domain-containing protein n=1 Tax=Fructilactobacillus ixorae TaxID=1750535 RepID=A0ABY5C791_9LACO|nr:helix-turn-helix domain-containing protein [Fructilactobacillus ixorae]USS93975.1 helix-turn-helix domain-containing protein [Fructilactobacillus ixorae]
MPNPKKFLPLISAIPTDVLENSQLSASARLVFAFFFTYFNTHKQLKISYEKLAENTGLSVNTVKRSVKSLLNVKLISTIKNDDPFDHTNIYEMDN